MFSGSVRRATSWTQSRTVWLVGLESPIPLGGEMAGARLSISVRPQRQFANAGSLFSPLHQLLQANFLLFPWRRPALRPWAAGLIRLARLARGRAGPTTPLARDAGAHLITACSVSPPRM